jgi:hypothetical protein
MADDLCRGFVHDHSADQGSLQAGSPVQDSNGNLEASVSAAAIALIHTAARKGLIED